LTEANRRKNAEAEASLGDEALQAAKVLLTIGLPNDAVSRAYYAAFHYARAVLLMHGLEPRTHRGVIAVLVAERDPPIGLSREAISDLARLQTMRDTADYARSRVPRERAADEVAAAERFVAAARALLPNQTLG
jgi:hypothetical protein